LGIAGLADIAPFYAPVSTAYLAFPVHPAVRTNTAIASGRYTIRAQPVSPVVVTADSYPFVVPVDLVSFMTPVIGIVFPDMGIRPSVIMPVWRVIRIPEG